jgi:hypothetical protein
VPRRNERRESTSISADSRRFHQTHPKSSASASFATLARADYRTLARHAHSVAAPTVPGTISLRYCPDVDLR